MYGETQDSVRFRVEYLESALEISDIGDSAIFLLNPKVLTPDGEWEAWFFGNWLPGANRYRSFAELMEDEYHSFHERNSEVKRHPALISRRFAALAPRRGRASSQTPRREMLRVPASCVRVHVERLTHPRSGNPYATSGIGQSLMPVTLQRECVRIPAQDRNQVRDEPPLRSSVNLG